MAKTHNTLRAVYQKTNKCTLVLWIQFYCIVLTDMFRPLIWIPCTKITPKKPKCVFLCFNLFSASNYCKEYGTRQTQYIVSFPLKQWLCANHSITSTLCILFNDDNNNNNNNNLLQLGCHPVAVFMNIIQ